MLISPLLIVVVVVGFYLISSIKILNEYERAVIFRLGKLLDAPKGPGLTLVAWPIDRMSVGTTIGSRITIARRTPGSSWRGTRRRT